MTIFTVASLCPPARSSSQGSYIPAFGRTKLLRHLDIGEILWRLHVMLSSRLMPSKDRPFGNIHSCECQAISSPIAQRLLAKNHDLRYHAAFTRVDQDRQLVIPI